nr:MAG TPA: hypothetical protein [Caudoviricetes sp.]
MSSSSCFVLYILAWSESTSWLVILSIINRYVYFRLDGKFATSSNICELVLVIKSAAFSYQAFSSSGFLYT